MKKIVLHWTAGGRVANEKEKASYHFLVEGDGTVVEGDKPPEANRSPLGPDYVRHAGGFNSDSIGVSLCGMAGAEERPFHPGIGLTRNQYPVAVSLIADLCETYKITPSRNTVILHSEVRPRFGRGVYKWDVNWLPGMDKPEDPVVMGDMLRSDVSRELNSRSKVSWWARLRGWFNV